MRFFQDGNLLLLYFIYFWVGFCTLCFYFLTKMLHLNVPFFPLKCSAPPQKVTKMLGYCSYIGLLNVQNFNVSTQLTVQSA